MGSVELTRADLAKLVTFVQIAQAFVQIEAPALCAKMEALLKPPQEDGK